MLAASRRRREASTYTSSTKMPATSASPIVSDPARPWSSIGSNARRATVPIRLDTSRFPERDPARREAIGGPMCHGWKAAYRVLCQSVSGTAVARMRHQCNDGRASWDVLIGGPVAFAHDVHKTKSSVLRTFLWGGAGQGGRLVGGNLLFIHGLRLSGRVRTSLPLALPTHQRSKKNNFRLRGNTCIELDFSGLAEILAKSPESLMPVIRVIRCVCGDGEDW
ncbi:hypothetical protein BDR22DRAFT_32135 [Usnea florida]